MAGCNTGSETHGGNPYLTVRLLTALLSDCPSGFPEGEPSGTEHFLRCPALSEMQIRRPVKPTGKSFKKTRTDSTS